jgi:hypothetical protein
MGQRNERSEWRSAEGALAKRVEERQRRVSGGVRRSRTLPVLRGFAATLTERRMHGPFPCLKAEDKPCIGR